MFSRFSVFWGAMTLFMVLLLIGAFVAYGLDYFSYETLINIKLTRQAEMTFPSVTICNVSPINISRVNQSEILNMYYLKTHIYGRFFHSFINISDPFYAVLHENRTDSWLNETKFSKEKLFYHKEFEGQPCRNCFEDRRTDIGMCTTFNGLSNNPPLVSKLIGSQNGLSIFVFLDQNNYIYGENLGAGLLVSTKTTNTNSKLQYYIDILLFLKMCLHLMLFIVKKKMGAEFIFNYDFVGSFLGVFFVLFIAPL